MIMTKTLEKYSKNWNFMDERGVFPPINNENFPAGFFSIIGLFSEDANYNLKDCYVEDDKLFINGCSNEKQNAFMLRYNYGEEKCLVVAKVEFIHKRKGKMTELYRILKLIQRKYNTGPIVIECVNTEAMREWCTKNGFKEHETIKRNYIQTKI